MVAKIEAHFAPRSVKSSWTGQTISHTMSQIRLSYGDGENGNSSITFVKSHVKHSTADQPPIKNAASSLVCGSDQT
jgi:hypothetical protein